MGAIIIHHSIAHSSLSLSSSVNAQQFGFVDPTVHDML